MLECIRSPHSGFYHLQQFGPCNKLIHAEKWCQLWWQQSITPIHCICCIVTFLALNIWLPTHLKPIHCICFVFCVRGPIHHWSCLWSLPDFTAWWHLCTDGWIAIIIPVIFLHLLHGSVQYWVNAHQHWCKNAALQCAFWCVVTFWHLLIDPHYHWWKFTLFHCMD